MIFKCILKEQCALACKENKVNNWWMIRKMLRATYPKDHSSRERKIAVSWTIFVQAFAGRYQRYVQNLQELAIFIVRE